MINKGLKIDGSNISKPSGSWTRARNVMYNSVYDAIMGEYGMVNKNSINALTILGFEVTAKGIIIFSYDDTITTNSHGRISLFTADGTLYSVLDDTTNILGFLPQFPITATESYINAEGNIVCTFSDKRTGAGNRSRLLVCSSTGVLQNDISSNGLSRFPSPKLPTLVATNEFNGTLISGTYHYTVQYENKVGVRSNWFIPTRPLYVANGNDYFAEYDGLPMGAISNQSLKLTVSNIDTDFTKLRIGVIYKNGSTTTFNLFNEIPITPTTVNIVTELTNNDQFVEQLDILELTVKLPAFVNIGTETQLEKHNYIADLTTYEDDELTIQKVANTIIVHATVTWDALGTSSKKPDWAGFQSREVYALYLHMVRPDWTITRGFHIPGRAAIVGVDDTITAGNYPKAGYAYKYYSTNPYDDGTNAAPVYVNDTINNGGNAPTSLSLPSGHMDYWENEDEFYPNAIYPGTGSLTSDGLGNQAVRHHKFPSINEILTWADVYYTANPGDLLGDTGAAALTELGVTRFPRLGFITNSDIDFTTLSNKYIGAIITYAERNGNNSLVIGQDIWHQCSEPNGGTGICNNTGNWNLTDNGTGVILYNKHEDYIRLHAYPLLKNRLYVPENIFTALEYRFTLEDFSAVSVNPRSGFKNTGSAVQYTTFCNYTDINTLRDIPFTYANGIIDLTKVEYIPNNISKTYDSLTLNNTYCEEFVIAKVNDGGGIISKPSLSWFLSRNVLVAAVAMSNGEDNTGGDPYTPYSYLHTLQRYYNNVYLQFTNQRLAVTSPGSGVTAITIATDKRFGSSDATNVYPVLNGDTFAGRNCIISHSGLIPPITGFDGIKTIHLYPCESRFNLNLRYEADYLNPSGVNNSLYVPKTGYETDSEFVWMLTQRHSWVSAYEFYQEVMYDAINNIEPLLLWNINIKSFNTYPTRIARSLAYNLDTIDSSAWSNFPIADYYDHVGDFGTIWILEAFRDRLIIHCVKGLFLTRSIGRIEVDGSIDATISAGNMFDVAPIPITVSNGDYAGCQSKWGYILCEYGYFFGDLSNGQIYHLDLNGSLKQISADNKDWFIKYFKQIDAEQYDNPFYNATGGVKKLIIGYEPANDRLLCTIRRETYRTVTDTVNTNPITIATGNYSKEEIITINLTMVAAYAGAISVSYYNTVTLETVNIGSVTGGLLINQHVILTLIAPIDGNQIILTGNTGAINTTYIIQILNTNSYAKTISYNLKLNQWISEHDYYPRALIGYNKELYAVDNQNILNIYEFNEKDLTYKGKYIDLSYRYAWFIDVLYNDRADLTKVLQSVSWQSIVLPTSGTKSNLYDDTVSHIAILNDNQCSGEISLVNPNYYVNSNNRHRGGEWFFNQFKDLVADKRTLFLDENGKILTSNITNNKSYFEKSKFISKFVIVRFKHNNDLQYNGVRYDVILTDVKVNARLV